MNTAAYIFNKCQEAGGWRLEDRNTAILQGGADMAGGMMVGCQEAGRQ